MKRLRRIEGATRAHGRGSQRAARRIIVWAAVAALASGAGGGAYLHLRGVPKAWVYYQRVLDAELAGSRDDARVHLDRLANLGTDAARERLEAYVYRRAEKDRRLIDSAIELLVGGYPDSMTARGCRDYGAIRESDYLLRWRALRYPIAGTDEAEIIALRGWLRQYPRHPGGDDAHWVIGCFEAARGERVAALEHFGLACRSGDRDKHWRVIRSTLEVLHEAPADEIAWFRANGCPDEIIPHTDYVLALRTLRSLHFAEAARRLREVDLSAIAGGDSYLRRGQSHSVSEHVGTQRVFADRMAVLWTGYESATDDRSAAARLHEIARLCFHEHVVFGSALSEEGVVDNQTSLRGALIHPSTGYRQAAELFALLVERYPEYAELEAVCYSIPLCYFRARHTMNRLRRFRPGASALDVPIARGFADFVREFPQSSMVDEAAFQVRVHDPWAVANGAPTVRGPDWRWIDRVLGEPSAEFTPDERPIAAAALEALVRGARAISSKSTAAKPACATDSVPRVKAGKLDRAARSTADRPRSSSRPVWRPCAEREQPAWAGSS